MASVDDLHLDGLGLKSYSLVALHRHNLATVGDLRRAAPSWKALRDLAGVGPAAFDDIRERLTEHGVSLPETPAAPERQEKPRRARLQGPDPADLSCLVATLIPAGSATAQQLADGLDIPLPEVESSLRKLRRQGWVSGARIGGERHYLVPQEAVTRYRRWSRSVRWRCPRHERHRLD